MARTKASVGAKISSGKSSKARCTVAPTPSSSGSGSTDRTNRANSSGGGNSVCPRETPKWQRPITNFFINKTGRNDGDDDSGDEQTAGSSKPKPRRNVIESDNEDEIDVEKPKNRELEESIVLEPLDGESSHKISEYYTNNNNTSKGDVNGMQDDVNGTKDDVNGMKNNVNGMKDDVNEMKDDVESDVKDNHINEISDANGNKVEIKSKGKGVGKKTKVNKENLCDNVERRSSLKRDLEEGSEVENASKKIKVL